MNKGHIGHSSTIFNDSIYFTMRDVNIVGRIDIETGITNYLIGPNEESPYKTDLYGGICVTENEVILCPYNANYLWIYTKTDHKWTNYDIPWHGMGSQEYQFTGAFLKDNKVFMMGDHALDIYVFDLQLREGKYILKEKKQLWGGSYALWDNKLAVGISYTNNYLLLDLETYEQKTESISDIGRIAGIQYDDEKLWFVPRNCESGRIVVTDLSGNIINTYVLNNGGEVLGGMKTENAMYVYGMAMPTYKLNVDTGLVSRIDSKFFMTSGNDNKSKIATTFDGMILTFGRDTHKFEIKIDNNVMDEYIGLCKQYNGNDYAIMHEDGFVDLNYYIKLLI